MQHTRLLASVFLILPATTTPGTVMFPVSPSADGRHLQDATGAPFPILGRTAWFITSLSQTEYQVFLDDTAAKGHTAIEFHVINHDPRGNNEPFAGNGELPFLNCLDGSDWGGDLKYSDINAEAPDLTQPNEAYWTHVDALLAYAESKGVLAFMFPAYVGYAGGEQGWMQELVANGPARVQSYGAWIATRYAARGNIVWMMGGDMGTFDAAQTAVEQALLSGLQSVAGQQSTLFSAEWDSGSIATDQPTFGPSMTLNGAYSWSGQVSYHCRRAYEYTPVEPAFLLEEPYDEEGPDGNGVNPSATQPVRRFQWWGWLSSIGGYVSGNGYIWPFNVGWESHLNTPGAQDMWRLSRDAAEALGKLSDARAVEPLIKALGDRNSSIRQHAVVLLGKLGDTRAVEPLIQVLRDNDAFVRKDAADALGKLGDVRGVEPLIKALADPSGWLRKGAAEALDRLGESHWKALIKGDDGDWARLGGSADVRAIHPLIKALGDEHASVRRHAMTVLGRLRDARAVEPLIGALGDSHEVVRQAAVQALGKLGDARAVEPLIKALEDDDTSVRKDAAEVLGKLGDARAVEPLIKALEDDGMSVRKGAAEAREEPDEACVVDPLIEAFVDDDPFLLKDAGEALGGRDTNVHGKAAQALRRLMDPREVDALVDALWSSSEYHKVELRGPGRPSLKCRCCGCTYFGPVAWPENKDRWLGTLFRCAHCGRRTIVRYSNLPD